MKSESKDLRVRLTRKLLRDALIQSMKTKHISEITVKSLCEAAQVNRSTFYSHYNNPQDLLEQIEQDVMENVERYIEKKEYMVDDLPSVKGIETILEYVKENSDIFNVLFSENSNLDFAKSILQLSQIIVFNLNTKYDDKTRDYIAIFGISGCISVLKKWLEEGTQETPERISKFFHQILYQGIVSFE